MKRIIALILAVMMMSISGCSAAKNGYPVKIGDVELKEAPETVAALSPSLTSVITALGFNEKIVAAADGSIVDSGVKLVGPASEPDAAAVIAAAPNLIIAQADLPDEAANAFASAGIPVVYVAPAARFSELSEYYGAIARIFAGEEEGSALAEQTTGDIKLSLEKVAKTVENRRTAIIMPAYSMCVPSDSFASDILEFAGFENAAAGRAKYAITAAETVEAAPQVIFCESGMEDRILEDPALAEVPAVKDKQVYGIKVTDIELQGKSLIAIAEQMYKVYLLVPETEEPVIIPGGEEGED